MRKNCILIRLLITLLLSFSFLPSSSLASFEGDQPADFGERAAIEINEGIPSFTAEDITAEAYISFSPLDRLGRTGRAEACLGPETMAEAGRVPIEGVKPSGWQIARYDDLIEDRYLYNRCHVIGFQLTGDNGTPENLFTGTRYLNVSGMLPYENRMADYIRDTGNHVLYRACPVYEEDDLVASGIHLEGYSVEDSGAGICFNVYLANVQPGILIDYGTGESRRNTGSGPLFMIPDDKDTERSASDSDTRSSAADSEVPGAPTYILNTNSRKFHDPSCPSVAEMKENNKRVFYGTREEAVAMGYEPCGRCRP